MRNAGLLQDYNFMTAGLDKHLVDFWGIDPAAFEQRVLSGGTDDECLAWVRAHGKPRTQEKIAQWNHMLLSSGAKDEAARVRFQGRLQEIAAKRGVAAVFSSSMSTWAGWNRIG
jgi:hypothetical protein